MDEVRATIQDEQGTTAFFLFTTLFGVGNNELRLYGKSANLVLDNTNRTILRVLPSNYKSYMRYFFAPWTDAREQLRNSSRNMRLFARNDFHMDYGMKKLMGLYYAAVREDGPDPIPYDQILRTASIMEKIFRLMPGSRVPDERPVVP